MNTTYILTAEMDADSFAWLDRLRREHFPAKRNLLPAHLTFFHRLTSAQTTRLVDLTLPSASVAILFDTPLLLGVGVAIRLRSPDLDRLRNAAQHAMGGEFSRQDLQPWRPHVTIQNKVSSDAARSLHRTMEMDFVPRVGAVTGLLLWEYLGGPWKLVDRTAFGIKAQS